MDKVQVLRLANEHRGLGEGLLSIGKREYECARHCSKHEALLGMFWILCLEMRSRGPLIGCNELPWR